MPRLLALSWSSLTPLCPSLCPARSFRGTIDEQIVDLHKDIKSGKLVMADGRLPWDAIKKFKHPGQKW